jgi:hypothetical protein
LGFDVFSSRRKAKMKTSMGPHVIIDYIGKPPLTPMEGSSQPTGTTA